jgi:hypothetical protein
MFSLLIYRFTVTQDAIAVLNDEKDRNAKLYEETEKRFKALIK